MNKTQSKLNVLRRPQKQNFKCDYSNNNNSWYRWPKHKSHQQEQTLLGSWPAYLGEYLWPMATTTTNLTLGATCWHSQ
ncbi:hypothetical protein ACLKA7_016987 [Drosophila subpalustris]